MVMTDIEIFGDGPGCSKWQELKVGKTSVLNQRGCQAPTGALHEIPWIPSMTQFHPIVSYVSHASFAFCSVDVVENASCS